MDLVGNWGISIIKADRFKEITPNPVSWLKEAEPVIDTFLSFVIFAQKESTPKLHSDTPAILVVEWFNFSNRRDKLKTCHLLDLSYFSLQLLLP